MTVWLSPTQPKCLRDATLAIKIQKRSEETNSLCKTNQLIHPGQQKAKVTCKTLMWENIKHPVLSVFKLLQKWVFPRICLLHQAPASQNLWAKSSPTPGFVNKVLLAHNHTHLFTHCPGCLGTTSTEGCCWKTVTQKAKDTQRLAFYRHVCQSNPHKFGTFPYLPVTMKRVFWGEGVVIMDSMSTIT